MVQQSGRQRLDQGRLYARLTGGAARGAGIAAFPSRPKDGMIGDTRLGQGVAP